MRNTKHAHVAGKYKQRVATESLTSAKAWKVLNQKIKKKKGKSETAAEKIEENQKSIG